MSRDAVMKFFEAIQKDEVIVVRLRALEGDFDAFARLAAELGREREFVFEPSDVREVLDALAAKAEGGLSDGELSAVSGGTGQFGAFRPTYVCRVVGLPGRTLTCLGA